VRACVHVCACVCAVYCSSLFNGHCVLYVTVLVCCVSSSEALINEVGRASSTLCCVCYVRLCAVCVTLRHHKPEEEAYFCHALALQQ